MATFALSAIEGYNYDTSAWFTCIFSSRHAPLLCRPQSIHFFSVSLPLTIPHCSFSARSLKAQISKPNSAYTGLYQMPRKKKKRIDLVSFGWVPKLDILGVVYCSWSSALLLSKSLRNSMIQAHRWQWMSPPLWTLIFAFHFSREGFQCAKRKKGVETSFSRAIWFNLPATSHLYPWWAGVPCNNSHWSSSAYFS